MLRIIVAREEKIDRALKRYRNKVRKTKQIQLLRSNESFKKKSTKKREQLAKAKYKQLLQDREGN